MRTALAATGARARNPALGLQAAAGLLWPVVATGLGALAMVAIAGDHLRLVRLDPSIVPEGFTPATFAQALDAYGLSPAAYALVVSAGKALLVGTFFGLAIIIWRHRQSDPGALLGAYVLVLFAGNWEVEPARMPAWAAPLLSLLGGLALAALLNFLLVFPDQHYRPRWTIWLGLGLPALAIVGQFFPVPPPATIAIFVAMLVLSLAVVTNRYLRHSTAAQRQQTRWLLVGFATTVGLVGLVLAVSVIWNPTGPSAGAATLEMVGQVIGQVAFIPIPIAIAIAITRHHLWDVDWVINRALLYGVLTAALGLVYFAVAFAVGSVLGSRAGAPAAIVTAILVAVLLQPVRRQVQVALNRAMYGRRDDPYSALSRLGAQLSASLPASNVLQVIAATIRESLHSPLVEIRADDRSVLASAGTPAAGHRATTLPVVHQGERVGELLVVPRAGDDHLAAADSALLRDLAYHAGVAIHDLHLRSQLQTSRERLVVAREEERRRLSRILHDDLGATLAAQKLKAGGIRAHVHDHPDGAARDAGDLEADLAATIRRLRELAYELRPPALEDLGLREALTSLLRAPRGGLTTRLLADSTLPALPAAVELSVYRIVEQAYANTLRHAGASCCVVEITTGDEIIVTVTDDGIGLGEGVRHGLGINSMRERAEELGGKFVIGPSNTGGTRVVASIPLHHR